MRVKRDPSHKAVDYFEGVEGRSTAYAVLSICQSIVARRFGSATRGTPRKRARVNDDAAVSTHDGIGIKP